MDSFVTAIIIIVIAAIASWFKKLGQTQNTEEDPRTRRTMTTPGEPRPQAAPRPQSGPVSWEEELRRLLEGDTPSAPPPLRPPPAVITQAPRAIPPTPPPLMRPTFTSSPRPRPVIVSPPPVPGVFETPAPSLATFQESSTAYQRASTLDTTMAQYMQGVSDHPVQLTTVVRSQTSPELLQAVSLFQNARSARQAIIASIILGPPKALEQPAADF